MAVPSNGGKISKCEFQLDLPYRAW